jgi:Cellulase (glycosyl hydrolase family 5)
MTRAGLVRVRTGFGARDVVAGAALMLVAVLATAAAAGGAAAAPRTTSGATCGKAAGPFTVSGTKVLGAGGKPFVSYGFTVAGLQGPNWGSSVGDDLDEINAADNWCANTVRLQLDQDDLLGSQGTGFDQGYLTAIESEVSQAEIDHLVVVLNDETNYAPASVAGSQLGPTAATETFWKDLVKVYGDDPQVIFDLFNEPRTYSPGMSSAQEWQLWLDGGQYNGVSYLGMADLAGYVRNTLSTKNLFWIEGPDWSSSFAGMLQQGAQLSVSNVVYAVHHPAGQPEPSSWNADFGYLVTSGSAPVVEGEWTNYEPTGNAQPSGGGACWANAPTAVPAFLKYLAAHGIGLSAYTLQQGYLIKSSSNMDVPNTINAKTWTCQTSQESQPGQGAGAEIMSWFKQRNG